MSVNSSNTAQTATGQSPACVLSKLYTNNKVAAGGSTKNALGLTLPGTSLTRSIYCEHSVDAMLAINENSSNLNKNSNHSSLIIRDGESKYEEEEKPKQHYGGEKNGVDSFSTDCELGKADEPFNKSIKKNFLTTPPLICEQGPSQPSSPTTSSPGAHSAKRPCPLSVDALKRINLLSPNYLPPSFSCQSVSNAMAPALDASKLSAPVSPGYPTSDLGSSPRSSISTSHSSSLGINANWTIFRDPAHSCSANINSGRHSYRAGPIDDDSDCGGAPLEVGLVDASNGDKDAHNFLSPRQMLSPTPYSPFSDCGVADLNVGCSSSTTPYSIRSPNISPSPIRRVHRGDILHFSFDPMRSRSSLSNHGGSTSAQEASNGTVHHISPKHSIQLIANAIAQPRLLNSEARERSRSEGEALAFTSDAKQIYSSGRANNDVCADYDEDERMDISDGCGHSTLSVPTGGAKGCRSSHLHAGQKRRRPQLLQKDWQAEKEETSTGGTEKCLQKGGNDEQATIRKERVEDDNILANGNGHGQQPIIEEPPPSPTLVELFQPADLNKERRKQIDEWIRQQTAALEAFRHSLVPTQQESNFLQVPTMLPKNSLEQLWPHPTADFSQAGPIRPMLSTMWRRSCSESDVTAAVAAVSLSVSSTSSNNKVTTSGDCSTTTSMAGSRRRQSHQHQQPTALLVPLNEATYVCEHCGQGFSMHDRLAKHIASRHRDRSESTNDENNRVYKCQLCTKSFGRSDMLTRHMRLHTGLKPYACHLCGQVFSRSDHLSTHQRTHTGEKPYRCPQCNYAASRRDMITRHMRTHLMGSDGLPASPPPNMVEMQFPPINKLSLSPPSPPPSKSTTTTTPSFRVPQSTDCHHLAQTTSGGISSDVSNITILSERTSMAEEMSSASISTSMTGEIRKSASHLNVQFAKLFPAAVSASEGGEAPLAFAGDLLGSHLMFGGPFCSTKTAHLPDVLRRSSPNLLMTSGPSAFRPPSSIAHTTTAIDPSIAAAAAVAQVRQILSRNQMQHQPRLSLSSLPITGQAIIGGINGTTVADTFPLLFRQHSFGEPSFSGQQQQR